VDDEMHLDDDDDDDDDVEREDDDALSGPEAPSRGSPARPGGHRRR